ncbi:hypothetical protein SAMN05192534_12326 [Alteribacillus persepolensis]|uniref:Uncharacterized protein n=1 Tax=Alteribacillus persepolensis TaxID=568899 RepID=A0A1G8I799_9BACI|nr:hypothetical protein [Alteribacillus persepolensis]SDI14849.1 hypothetical protein SAMN05192534_12326 [Alteribacillus persepolensis]
MPKLFVLWVTTKHEDGGHSARQYRWGRDSKFTYMDALREKEKIQDDFYNVEIMEF